MSSAGAAEVRESEEERIVNLLVGGVSYMTLRETLRTDSDSILSTFFDSPRSIGNSIGTPRKLKDGTVFIDRDGALFRYILDYLRSGKLTLPDDFREYARLLEEARFYGLKGLAQLITAPQQAGRNSGNFKSGGSKDSKKLAAESGRNSRQNSGSDGSGRGNRESSESTGETAAELSGVEGGNILIGYRGTFAFGRDGQADVKFRKLTRILVCGKSSLCREVFGETLNESRDPDRTGENRYTARLYLKHNSLENAFDMLTERGFRMVGSAGSGASCTTSVLQASSGSSDLNVPRAGTDNEEARWNHYNEFIFFREQR